MKNYDANLLPAFGAAQVQAFANASMGWFFWSLKHNIAGGWRWMGTAQLIQFLVITLFTCSHCSLLSQFQCDARVFMMALQCPRRQSSHGS